MSDTAADATIAQAPAAGPRSTGPGAAPVGECSPGPVAGLAPLLLDARQAATLLGIGRSLFLSLHSAGRVPAPLRLGRRCLWRRQELCSWIEAGCPPRGRWETLCGDRRGRRTANG